jgi:mRNA-degrading endonuclease YafQ of YafQ-DinJ toxin-antitoxin module
MQILQTNIFKKAVKKLHANQKICLDNAVKALVINPLLGVEKMGDLSSVRVYKFRMVDCLTLLAYQYDEQKLFMMLLALGSHENFYQNLKTQIN